MNISSQLACDIDIAVVTRLRRLHVRPRIHLNFCRFFFLIMPIYMQFQKYFFSFLFTFFPFVPGLGHGGPDVIACVEEQFRKTLVVRHTVSVHSRFQLLLLFSREFGSLKRRACHQQAIQLATTPEYQPYSNQLYIATCKMLSRANLYYLSATHPQMAPQVTIGSCSPISNVISILFIHMVTFKL